MLDTNIFLEKLIEHKYTHLCVVPCSFASNIINAIINNNKIEYIASASEAVACSIAAGLKLSGKKPIVIIQSSGLTNMGSCITSLLKPFNITFPIITSWRTYNDGDSEVQHQHLATKLPMLIESYGYTHSIINQDNINKAIEQINMSNISSTICVLKKDTFSKIELKKEHQTNLNIYPKRSEFLKILNHQYNNTDTVMIGTTGNTSREMYSFMPNTKNFYMVGNMGGALSLGLGMAKAGKKVVILGGDAEFVMHLGGLTTAGRYKNINLTYILFDNEQNKSTGGQNTYQNHINYINLVESTNFNVIKKTITTIDKFTNILNDINNGLNFIYVKCALDEEAIRPPLEVVKNIGVFS